MGKEVAGKIFSTPEEAGVTPPTEAESLTRASYSTVSGSDR